MAIQVPALYVTGLDQVTPAQPGDTIDPSFLETATGPLASLSTGLSTTGSQVVSLSTSSSTTASSLSTSVSSLSTSTSTSVSSLSTGLSTTGSRVTSLSTSTSTAVSSLSTGLSTTSSLVGSLSTVVGALGGGGVAKIIKFGARAVTTSSFQSISILFTGGAFPTVPFITLSSEVQEDLLIWKARNITTAGFTLEGYGAGANTYSGNVNWKAEEK